MKKTYITVPIVIALTLSILIGQIIPNCMSYVAPVTGAIFTTDKTGLLVNGNIYEYGTDVYLSGGPGPNAPPTAAGLPDAEYYFQVTDPPGKKLLSTDDIKERKFLVEGGIITKYLGTTHKWNAVPEIPGAIVIQLWPFDKTPNKGGVYKAWATPVEDYDPKDSHSFWGFIPKYSKTDNYKVRIPKQVTLTLDKFYDVNNNGIYDDGDYLITGWRIDVKDPLGVTNTYYTPKIIDVTGNPGTYTATEELPAGWEQTAVAVNGVYIVPPKVTVNVNIPNGGTHSVLYGNRKLPPPPAKLILDKFNDTNGNGIYDAGDVKIANWKIDVTDPHGATITYLTPKILEITDFGAYTITEDLPGDWKQTAVEVDGIYKDPPTITVTVEINSGETHSVLYGNQKIPAPLPPPPVKVWMSVVPIYQKVGSDIAFSWEVLTILPELEPQKIELALDPTFPPSNVVYTATNFPTDYKGTYIWTATPPTGTWWIMVTYYYTYLGTTYIAGTFTSFTVY